MDPIVAVYAIKLTVRATEGSDVTAPTIEEIEAIVQGAIVENLSGNGTLVTANATAERTDN